MVIRYVSSVCIKLEIFVDIMNTLITKRCWWTSIHCINILDEERYLHQLAWWECSFLFSNKLKCECLLMSSTRLVGLQFPAHQSSGSSVLWCQLKLDGIGNHPCTNTCKLKCFLSIVTFTCWSVLSCYWWSVLYRMLYQWDLGMKVEILHLQREMLFCWSSCVVCCVKLLLMNWC